MRRRGIWPNEGQIEGSAWRAPHTLFSPRPFCSLPPSRPSQSRSDPSSRSVDRSAYISCQIHLPFHLAPRQVKPFQCISSCTLNCWKDAPNLLYPAIRKLFPSQKEFEVNISRKSDLKSRIFPYLWNSLKKQIEYALIASDSISSPLKNLELF